jgi:amidase
MARNVQDLAQLLAIQAGFDPQAPLSIADDGQRFLGSLHMEATNVARARIGWLANLDGHLPMEAGILEVCEQALQRLAGLGCRVEPAALGMEPSRIWEGWLVWRKLLVASRIAPFLLKADNRGHIKPEALWEHDQAQGVTGAQFMAASTIRTAFYQRMLALFEGYDYLALPVAQVWPFDVDARWPQQINGVPMDTYHRWMEVVIYATFAGLPCISVPAGFNADGLPMGLQLIGRPQADFALLQLAHAYEQVAQDVLQRAPIQQAR